MRPLPLSLRSALRLCSALLLAAGCHHPVPTSGSGKGSLTVNVQGVSQGVVTVTGPDGFNAQVAATATLSDLSPGAYQISAAPFRSRGAHVDSEQLPTIDLPTVMVVADETASAQVLYQADPMTGRMWSTGMGATDISVFGDAQLGEAGSTPERSVAVTSPDGGVLQPQRLAFDSSRRVWATYLDAYSGTPNQGAQQLVAWTRDALLSDRESVPPSVVLSATDVGGGVPSLDSPLSLAFDGSGRLWAGNCGWITGNASLVAFSPQALATSGAPTPDHQAVLTGCPEGLSFDAQGALWVVQNAANMIYGFTASDLTSAVPVASTTLHLSDPYDYPTASAFDAEGTLWVAQCGSFKGLTGYRAGTLAAGVDVDPDLTLTSSDWTCPVGLSFDNAGSLWVLNIDDVGSLTNVDAATLSVSGAVTPSGAQSIPVSGFGWGGMAFLP